MAKCAGGAATGPTPVEARRRRASDWRGPAQDPTGADSTGADSTGANPRGAYPNGANPTATFRQAPPGGDRSPATASLSPGHLRTLTTDRAHARCRLA